MTGYDEHDAPPTVALRVAVVDDHALGRDLLAMAIARTPDCEVVLVTSSTGHLPTAAVAPLDAVVLVIGAPGPDVIDELRAVVVGQPSARIVVVAIAVDDRLVEGLRHAGADAVVSTRTSLAGVLDHLRGLPPGPEEHRGTADREARARRHGITAREHEILDRLAEGLTPQQIARHLDIRLHTVRDHLAALRRKLDCSNATQLVVTAHRLGLAPHVGRPLR